MTDVAPPTLTPVHELAATCPSAADLSRHVWFEGRVPAPSTNNRSKKPRATPPPPLLPPPPPSLSSSSSGVAPAAFVPRDMGCYKCHKTRFCRRHGFYASMCAECGALHYEKLMHRGHVPGLRALVVGARTKIGYQVALRLLRAGAVVKATTRFPERCVFHCEPDWAEWKDRLQIVSLDLNQPAAAVNAAVVKDILQPSDELDALFVVAAQTIRGIERREGTVHGVNRYGDAKFFAGPVNSWLLRLGAVTPEEMEEVMRVNTVGPMLLVQAALPALLRSTHPRKCVVLTHAREGMFQVAKKSPCHPHTNMAKAGLHMLTHMMQVTYGGELPCYGVDPGWISVDEYGADAVPFGGTGHLPLTELDAAAKLTDPLLAPKRPPVRRGTIRHYDYFCEPEF